MKHKLILLVAGASLLAIAGFFLLNSRAKSNQSVIKIMPLGDSITQGEGGFDSYRRALWLMLQKSGAKVDFVGSMKMNFPDSEPLHSDFDMDHEGHWGWKADEILAQLDGWARKFRPDVVLVHLGSNDIFRREPHDETVAELAEIIATLRKHNPRVKILVATLISVADPGGDELISELNDLLPAMVKRLTTPESPVILVDQYEGFDPYRDTYDRIHPNEAGAKKMARKWLEAIASALETE